MPRNSQTKSAKQSSINQSKGLGLLIGLTVFLAAASVWQRLDRWQVWPNRFHVMRQYDSAIRSRDIWLRMRPLSTLTTQETTYLESVPAHRWMEPPASEMIVALVYLAIGYEAPSISTWVATTFWVTGAWFLYSASRTLTENPWTRFASLAYYLVQPWGVLICRTFQPEPLMILGFLVAVSILVRGRFLESWRKAVLTGLVCGFLLLPKPGFMLFPLLGVLVGVCARDNGAVASLKNPKFYVASALVALPSFLWIAGVVRSHDSFIFSLLFDPRFAHSLLSFIDLVIGVPFFIAVVFGVVAFARAKDQLIYLGIIVGYLLFTVATNYRSATHSYYHVTLIPLVALLLIPACDVFFKSLSVNQDGQTDQHGKRIRAVAAAVCTVLWIGFATLVQQPVISRTQYAPLSKEDYSEIAREIGTGGTVIGMTDDYGRILQFHGWLHVLNWPNRADIELEIMAHGSTNRPESMLSNFRQQGASHFVVTSSQRARQENDFLEWMSQHFPAVGSERASYAIFDVRTSAEK